jgi:hypothetical protein
MDPLVIEHCRQHPEVMEAFDDLAARYGQSIEAALAPPEADLPPGVLLVRYSVSKEPVAAIEVNGTVLLLVEED